MRQEILGRHDSDPDGNPKGGVTTGRGIEIWWQDGPLGRGDARREPNGAFVEGVIEAALDRLRYYQDSRFHCRENADAIDHLEAALQALDARTRNRESRQVEGTHTA